MPPTVIRPPAARPEMNFRAKKQRRINPAKPKPPSGALSGSPEFQLRAGDGIKPG
ncbi:MAG: hypothetical protein HC875_21075 [Anaerolineales bacterium]|nr:hypothetical protein [Anaerolineales bacterium]